MDTGTTNNRKSAACSKSLCLIVSARIVVFTDKIVLSLLWILHNSLWTLVVSFRATYAMYYLALLKSLCASLCLEICDLRVYLAFLLSHVLVPTHDSATSTTFSHLELPILCNFSALYASFPFCCLWKGLVEYVVSQPKLPEVLCIQSHCPSDMLDCHA